MTGVSSSFHLRGGRPIEAAECERSLLGLLQSITWLPLFYLLLSSSTCRAVSPDQVVIAEGGAQYLYPEMTMRAYNEAMSNGADFVTCSIAMTSDKKAFCHPFVDLSRTTNILDIKRFAKRGTLSFNFSLKEILRLRAKQSKPANRTVAFDGAFQVATPEGLIEAINLWGKQHSDAKEVGVVFEINAQSTAFEGSPSALSYVINLLRENKWTTTSAPAMVASNNQSVLSSLVQEGVPVRRLLRVVPSQGSANTTEGLTTDAIALTPDGLVAINDSATGIILHVDSILYEVQQELWGVEIPKLAWNGTVIQLVKNLTSLAVYVWGFTESTWGSRGRNFNTFLSDPLAMYLSLLNQTPAPDGVATDWPATAAKAIGCYHEPVPLNPTSGLAKDRPLLISSGGAAGLMPAHLNISFMQAIIEGADYIDCILQVSRDKVLFCLESMQLSKYTNVKTTDLVSRNKTYTTNGPDPQSDWWSFDFDWAEIQTLKVFPTDGSQKPPDFFNKYPPLSFDEFIDIAKNANRTVGLHVKIDYPTFLSGKKKDKPEVPIDQISLLLDKLRDKNLLGAGNIYDKNGPYPLVVASSDSCGLLALRNITGGTLQLVQRINQKINTLDSCASILNNTQNTTQWWVSNEGLKLVATFARGVSPRKQSFMKINNASAGNPLLYGVIDPGSVNPLVLNAQPKGLDVYVRTLSNTVHPGDGEGAYDFLSDPTVELEYYFDQIKVTALEAKFLSTVAGFLVSSCRPRPGVTPTPIRFNVTKVDPGHLADEIIQVRKEMTETTSRENRALVIAMSLLGAVVFLCALLAVFAFFWWRRRTERNKGRQYLQATIESFGQIPMVRHFTHAELLAATDNFSEEKKLGKGGFGAVYKGVMPDGTTLAVKKLHVGLDPSAPLKKSNPLFQLLNEVKIISTVHNRNVVPIQGLCIENELLLVYDYMPNGSLQDAIFDKDYPIKLDWRQWFNIAVGTAKGIAYLHEECEHKVIHRDIKPDNILLDAQLNPRVADFGIARNVDMDQTHVTTKVMGSIGYMAPDYAITGVLNENSDTYSYGILLMTIITGRKPLHVWAKDGEEATMEWVRRKSEGGLQELLTIVHPKFDGAYDEREMIRLLYTALLCSQNDPALRPPMSDVVLMLLGKKDVPHVSTARAAVTYPSYLRKNSVDSTASYSAMPWSTAEDSSAIATPPPDINGSTARAITTTPTPRPDFDESRDFETSQLHDGR